ncbi:MAG TPA: hypothetical protein VIF15_16375 [Polyangiaceae bacterium]|jgi:hypothetical protein
MALCPEARPPKAARRARVVTLVLAAPAIVALVAQVADAQPRRPPAAPPRAHAPARPAPPGPRKPAAASDAGAPASSVAAPMAAGTAYVPPGSATPVDAGVVESKTLDGGTHVFKFSELDIEGRLKSPQLVYFLRRVRAEFAAGDLGHRTFMREMSETRKESSF